MGVIVILAGMAAYFWVYPWYQDWRDDGDSSDNDDDGNDPVVPDELAHAFGSGAEDWWTVYPSQNPDAGDAVPHLSWVLDQAIDRPVMLFVHSTGCAPCATQTGYIETALADLAGHDIFFDDILADGTNPKSNQVFEVYDPSGTPNYIPLTVIVSYALDADGDPTLVWHSVEGATSVLWLTSYLTDALMYYE